MDLSRRLCCRFACASVVAGLTAFAAAPTHGSLILHDGFPMGDGSSLYEEGNLIGQPGAGGNWAGSSRLAGGGIQVPGGTANHGHFPGGDPATFGVHGQGLGYPGILSEGGHATVGTFLISDASAAGTQFVRREVDGLSTAQRDTGDYYFSLIAQAPDGPLPGDDRIMGGFTRGDQGFGFYIGFEGDKVVVFGRGFGQVSTTWFARTLTDENDDELAYDPGESYFFLARYESSNNRIMTVWANPVIEDGEVVSSLGSWSGVTAMTHGNDNITSISLYSRTGTTDDEQLRFASFDEFRIGTTLESVTPIPEPASLALMGLGGFLMLSRRGRQV